MINTDSVHSLLTQLRKDEVKRASIEGSKPEILCELPAEEKRNFAARYFIALHKRAKRSGIELVPLESETKDTIISYLHADIIEMLFTKAHTNPLNRQDSQDYVFNRYGNLNRTIAALNSIMAHYMRKTGIHERDHIFEFLIKLNNAITIQRSIKLATRAESTGTGNIITGYIHAIDLHCMGIGKIVPIEQKPINIGRYDEETRMLLLEENELENKPKKDVNNEMFAIRFSDYMDLKWLVEGLERSAEELHQNASA
jgi:hypothetical protein